MKHHLSQQKRTGGDRASSRRIHPRAEDCEPAEPANTVTDRLNDLLKASGPGFILRLCPRQSYLIQAPISFSAPYQEISTLGYPTGNERATLIVNGPVENGIGHTTAVYGNCAGCSGVKLRNIQIDGTRLGAPPTAGGGNIEMGGENVTDQVVEYVRSYDPRGWSCLHVAEGSLNCHNATVQYNDIGPCGSDTFQEWADGIGIGCRNSVVKSNMIKGATDGGIVIFGAPGTQVYNNTIWVLNQTLLGGINMVDYIPFTGDFGGTVVRNNTIFGGFATENQTLGGTKGSNAEDAVIKIGIAIGPRTWFGDKFGNNFTYSGVVVDNQLTGAFSYGIAITSAQNFTVENNILIGNTSFIGVPGPNCSNADMVPNPGPFIVDTRSTQGLSLQSDFQNVKNGDSLVCVVPPSGGDDWPFGAGPSGGSMGSPGSKSGGGNSAKNAGITIGVILILIAIGFALLYVRKRSVKAHRPEAEIWLAQYLRPEEGARF